MRVMPFSRRLWRVRAEVVRLTEDFRRLDATANKHTLGDAVREVVLAVARLDEVWADVTSTTKKGG